MSTRGKVYRRTQEQCPAPWAYVVSRGDWLTWLVRGHEATWQRAFDRVLQIIRTEDDA